MNTDFYNELDKKINAEKLLFQGKIHYTDEEKEAMRNIIVEKLHKNLNYTYYMYGYFNKLLIVCGENSFEKDGFPVLEMAKYEKNYDNMYNVENIIDFSCYLCHERFGIPNGEFYADMIANRIMTATEVVYHSIECLPTKENITNYIITNNYFFEVYPEFFQDKKLDRVKEIANLVGRDSFATRKEYKDYKKAKKVLMNHIKAYTKEQNTKIKVKKK